ncbi:HPr(Ser) kinase/phosphatase [Citroniella saccharovorans]|uniref:HPr kinase/phosphorylase n=1 Tax=Citroniella saccharovorans TaxID=2053367 RepID=A0AAW9MY96_9FIRM|nr:HPr(Ser) kinase/phosphatase [Citroniella saccharovorans]MEB3429464.1 HPr(Ser) kinase/phosphatase [Citroniella saccharovorans]
MKSITIKEIQEKLNLDIIVKSSDFETRSITNDEVNRPGLQLAGYMEGFPFKRLQLIGKVEADYLKEIDDKIKYQRFKDILSYPIPALIFTHNNEISDQIIELAKYHNKTILRTSLTTTRLITRLAKFLDEVFAEEVTIHADLLEVFGMGVLITGDSSVGKSETALDLITRGHRLVADDVVDVVKLDGGLRGQSPKNIRHFLEIRGIGIIDIQRLYGIGSVKPDTFIDVVIHLEPWDDKKEYDRLGLDDYYTEILGEKIPIINVPVKPGRNIAMIVEVAIRNTRQKNLGYNAAVELNKRLIEDMNKK